MNKDPDRAAGGIYSLPKDVCNICLRPTHVTGTAGYVDAEGIAVLVLVGLRDQP